MRRLLNASARWLGWGGFLTSVRKPAYPFHVDSTFLDQGATLADARIVRLH